MRKSVSAIALVVILSTTLPLAAAPLHRNSDSFFTRIAKIVRAIVTLDLNEPTPPKP